MSTLDEQAIERAIAIADDYDDDPRPAVRRNAMVALGAIGDARAVPKLLAGMGDEEEAVRKEALAGLVDLADRLDRTKLEVAIRRATSSTVEDDGTYVVWARLFHRTKRRVHPPRLGGFASTRRVLASWTAGDAITWPQRWRNLFRGAFAVIGWVLITTPTMALNPDALVGLLAPSAAIVVIGAAVAFITGAFAGPLGRHPRILFPFLMEALVGGVAVAAFFVLLMLFVQPGTDPHIPFALVTGFACAGSRVFTLLAMPYVQASPDEPLRKFYAALAGGWGGALLLCLITSIALKLGLTEMDTDLLGFWATALCAPFASAAVYVTADARERIWLPERTKFMHNWTWLPMAALATWATIAAFAGTPSSHLDKVSLTAGGVAEVSYRWSGHRRPFNRFSVNIEEKGVLAAWTPQGLYWSGRDARLRPSGSYPDVPYSVIADAFQEAIRQTKHESYPYTDLVIEIADADARGSFGEPASRREELRDASRQSDEWEVGQPRGDDPAAAWMAVEPGAYSVSIRNYSDREHAVDDFVLGLLGGDVFQVQSDDRLLLLYLMPEGAGGDPQDALPVPGTSIGADHPVHDGGGAQD